MERNIRYYKNLRTEGLYKSEETDFNEGSQSPKIRRYNFNTEKWNGQIKDYEKTTALIKEGKVIIEITKEEALRHIRKQLESRFD